MSQGFSTEARRGVAEAVMEIERQTGAEIVVAFRRRSATYRETDYLVGVVVALVGLALLLYLPQRFALKYWVPDVALSFVLGALASSRLEAHRRFLVRRAVRVRAVREAARVLFHDLGVSRTEGRTGVLVYVSLLERELEIIADVGVPTGGPAWDAAALSLAKATRRRDPTTFLEALRALAPALGEAVPRCDDDRDEIPNEAA